MKIEGISEQNGIPTPENPIPIKVGQKIVVKDKSGNIIKEIPFNAETILKGDDYIYKDKNGKWYLRKYR